LLELFPSLRERIANKGSQLISTVRDGTTNLVDSAMNFLGVRYKLGGNTAESGFDCSGFTRYVFESSLGRVLPHRADEQANAPELAKVDKKDLKPGDLVFFYSGISHVGIYIGNGLMVDAPSTGQLVQVQAVFWDSYVGAVRIA